MTAFTPHTERGRKELNNTFFADVIQSNLRLVEECLRRGQNPNSIWDDSAALHIAAEKGDIALGYVLLGHERINVDIRNPVNRRTPLMLATQNGRREFVQFLIKHGANPNLAAHNGYTALHIAVKIKHFGIVYDLVNCGANTRAVNVYEETPLSLAAIDHPSASIASFLLRKGGLISHKQIPVLVDACLHCNTWPRLKIIGKLLEHGTDVDAVHPVTKMNCLHIVGITGYIPLAELLNYHGANLSARDAMGRTPLDVAEQHKHYDLVLLYQTMGKGKRRVKFK